MDWLIFFIGGLVVAAGGVFTCWALWDGDHEGIGILSAILGGIVLIASVILPVNAIARHMSAEDCSNWSTANGRPTKFVSYTWWDYDCVTPDGHGHWIPTGQIYVQIPKVEGP
jgi:hypothetical protein